MEFFRNPSINFVGGMKGAFTVSAVLVVLSLLSLLIHGGPRMSIDFTGGSVLQVKISPVPEVGDIRSTLEDRGYEGVQVTEFGSQDEFLITFVNPETTEETLDAAQGLLADLREGLSGSEIELRREETVGPKIGGELRSRTTDFVHRALLDYLVTDEKKHDRMIEMLEDFRRSLYPYD